MEEKGDGAPTKRPVLDKERLRKRFFGDVHKTAPKRTIPESGDTQRTAVAHQKTDQKASNDRVTEYGSTSQESNEALLERLAAEELLQEAARGRARAEIGGPSAWKQRRMKPNLRFVANSILQTEGQNRRKTNQLDKDKGFI